MLRAHPDRDVSDAFRKLQDALCSWERNTGRESLLIFREASGNICMNGPMPSDVVIRLDNGIPIKPDLDDMDDPALLRKFTDAIAV